MSSQETSLSQKAQEQVDKTKEVSKALVDQAASAASEAVEAVKEVAENPKLQSNMSHAKEKTEKITQSSQKTAKQVSGEIKSKAQEATQQALYSGHTLYEHAKSLTSNTVQYVKETAGLAPAKAAEVQDKAVVEAQSASNPSGQTLSGLVNQARELTEEALGNVKSYVAPTTSETVKKAEEKGTQIKDYNDKALQDGTQSSYIETARNLAVTAIEQAQSIISTASKTVEEKNAQASGTGASLATQTNEVAKGLQDIASNQAVNLQASAQNLVQSTADGLEKLQVKAGGYLKSGAGELEKSANAINSKS
ncbi:hypothetical protein O181_037330 [Austropuccinia psidii MF-1]|uniref:Uncharacterized protein n=1 Tax=Austropuccinia psidii MF-1 TaxID=1389203 RepID=A0A9Q3DAP6_9BASI|nr:hypothetical protein [Austropuccinia psidii MF-1]